MVASRSIRTRALGQDTPISSEIRIVSIPLKIIVNEVARTLMAQTAIEGSAPSRAEQGSLFEGAPSLETNTGLPHGAERAAMHPLPESAGLPQPGWHKHLGIGALTLIFTVLAVLGGIRLTRGPSSRTASVPMQKSQPDVAPGSERAGESDTSLAGLRDVIHLTPMSVRFGSQPIDSKSVPLKIKLTNTGTGAVKLRSISITDTNKSDFAQTNTCSNILEAGASCFITVRFTPSVKGKQTASVLVIDGRGSQQRVSLSGTGS